AGGPPPAPAAAAPGGSAPAGGWVFGQPRPSEPQCRYTTTTVACRRAARTAATSRSDPAEAMPGLAVPAVQAASVRSWIWLAARIATRVPRTVAYHGAYACPASAPMPTTGIRWLPTAATRSAPPPPPPSPPRPLPPPPTPPPR